MADYKMRFGKFKGYSLRDLPDSYIQWLLFTADFIDGDLLLYVQDEAVSRWGDRLPIRYIHRQENSDGIDRQKVKDVYRSLCREFHPDRGGSTLAQQVINRFYEGVTS